MASAVPNKYQRPSCEFHSPDYSLEWAYEPISKSIVFVLRANGDASFWTGVGFGDRNNNSMVDFIGVFVKNGGAQAGITDAFIDSTNGNLTPDPNSNVQTISIGVSNTALAENGTQVTAKFARPINSKDSKHDLDIAACTIFNLPLLAVPMETEEKDAQNYLKWLKQLRVCDIEKYCTVDVRELKLRESAKNFPSNKEELSPVEESKLLTQPIDGPKKEQKQADALEVAHSVDYSGTGDPCSYRGPHYSLNWSYNKASDCVDFVMRHGIKKGKWWSAVGIGDTMLDMDIGVLFLEDGKVQKISDFFSNSYGVPSEDVEQNWVLHKSKSKIVKALGGEEEDHVELYFSRVINSPDTERDRSMDGCVLFQFAANSGIYTGEGNNLRIHKHKDWPDLYKACDLKKRCAQSGTSKAHTQGHHQSKRGDGADSDVDLGQSLDDAASTTSSPGNLTLIEAAVGDSLQEARNFTERDNGPQIGNLGGGNDNVIDLLTRDATTTIAEQSTSTTESSLISSNPPNDADLLAQPPSSATSSGSSTTASSTSDTTTLPNAQGLNNETLELSTMLSLFGEFTTNDGNSTPETTTATLEGSTETSTTNAAVGAILGLLNRAGNDSASESNKVETTPAAPSTPTIETVTERIRNEMGTTLAAAAAAEALQTIPVTPVGSSESTTIPTTEATTAISTTKKKGGKKGRNNNGKGQQNKPENEPSSTTPETTSSGSSSVIPTDGSSTSQPALNLAPVTESNPGLEPIQQNPENLSTTSVAEFTTTVSVPTTSGDDSRIGSSASENVSTTGSVTTANPSASTRLAIITEESLRRNNITGTGISCQPLKPDLEVCHAYMDNYFGEVKQWADKHQELMDNQFGKACKLLSAVPHVPSLCCQIFRDKCAAHL
ncbi:DOMON domain-containing protein [Ditylenchus destructor]|uniref:DOMON domain-containing protein n=1 Tax=Ditylenchus destructor TaxID=166010 RepID=A0AAD4NET6_9BILA|nr:DOMON domain-containing protein [Ditylenchus destructor]